MNATHTTAEAQPKTKRTKTPAISPEALYRWSEIAGWLPIAREAWRLRVIAGTAPPAIRIGARCTVWRGADVLAWLDDPIGYKAPAVTEPA